MQKKNETVAATAAHEGENDALKKLLLQLTGDKDKLSGTLLKYEARLSDLQAQCRVGENTLKLKQKELDVEVDKKDVVVKDKMETLSQLLAAQQELQDALETAANASAAANAASRTSVEIAADAVSVQTYNQVKEKVSYFETLSTAAQEREVAMQAEKNALQVSIEEFKGLFFYTVVILCHVEWCIRQLWCSSAILYSITSIAHDHHTDILIFALF